MNIFFLLIKLYNSIYEKINDILPKIRKIDYIENNKVVDITKYFYIIKFLQFYCPYLVKYIDFYINKVKIDYYINNNYSFIYVNKIKMSEFVLKMNRFISIGSKNIYYNTECFNICSIKINEKEIDLSFFKEIIKKFKGLDSDYHRTMINYNISNKIQDILLFYNYKNIDSIEIIKIPNDKKIYLNNKNIYEII